MRSCCSRCKGENFVIESEGRFKWWKEVKKKKEKSSKSTRRGRKGVKHLMNKFSQLFFSLFCSPRFHSNQRGLSTQQRFYRVLVTCLKSLSTSPLQPNKFPRKSLPRFFLIFNLHRLKSITLKRIFSEV